MNSSTEPFGLPDDAPELARRFAVIMAGLGALIARRFLKMPHLNGFTLLLWNRLNRAARRFHQALISPGRVRAPRVRVDRVAMALERPVALPRARGWIVRELGWEAAAFMGYLEMLLAELATQAALAGAPRAGRILRPICRMLGVPAALTPKTIPAALTPKTIPAALTPKTIPAALTPRIGQRAVAVRKPAQSSGRSQTPHPGAEDKGEGSLPAQGQIFSGV